MKTINPYLIFNGNAEEAFTFYQSVFGGKLEKVRFSDMPGTDKMPVEDRNLMAHIALPLAGNNQLLMASDAPTGREVNLTENSGFYITLEPESREESERTFSQLSENGTVIMPLAKSGWAELFAMFSDKFGVQWMISYGEAEI